MIRPQKHSASRFGATVVEQGADDVRRRFLELETRYAVVMGAISESIYDWDIARDSFWFSENTQETIGVAPHTLRTSGDWSDRIHPEDLPRYRAALAAHCDDPTQPFLCDYRYRAADGSWRWARQHGRAHRDEKGRAVRMVGSIRDVTESCEHARELARQRLVLETTLDNVAMENARLVNETREALDEQKALAEVLGTISASIADTKPVFDQILESCQRLFKGHLVGLTLAGSDGLVHLGAYKGPDRERIEAVYPYPLDRDSGSGRAMLERRVVQFADVDAPGSDVPRHVVRGARAVGFKAAFAAPLIAEGRAIGALWVGRSQPGPFSDKQVTLLKSFADQAVIAIQNARLFKETRNALDEQKALAEVLGTISASIADTKPVFEQILESCQRLFRGHLVGLTLVKDGQVHLGAYKGENKEQMEAVYPYPLDRDSGTGRAILDRRVVHFADIGVPHSDAPRHVVRGAQAVGFKSIIFAPLITEGQALGALWVARRLPGPFGDKEIALLKTFADQAVIAIQNARLFNEIQEKSRQLEIANQHKSQFLANVSHELRTPLNAIIGFTRIVMRRSQHQLDPKQYENLERILASGQNLLALINAILDLAKVEAGRVEITPGEIDPARVLEQCIRSVEPLVREGEVTLVSSFDSTLPAMFVDEEKMRQIVVNLLSNAAKFTARGSIQLRARATQGQVEIAVIDTGIGIAADKLELVFQEFEQADTTSTRVHGGTGLGLTIARRLAHLMGGDIHVESTPGVGSTFTLTLPVRYGSASP